ncbi:hypothetical protein NLI96_g6682 [Meripilus lineatus]|uniref:NADP-dependent oxidoreductase domain-containing protein n=1 Tax=Meripilus lineatus TaxID=2056292 RepID=A0AAD5V5B6_9APHY|nr:hypothetical protein NLI96_g6682 [Physisporinus lineatus]
MSDTFNTIKQLNLPRDEIVVMTKVYFPLGKTYGDNIIATGKKPDEVGLINQHGLSRKVPFRLPQFSWNLRQHFPKHIFDSVKHSLERLQLDYIDVLQCHRFDYNTPIEETMQALHDVVQAGYVRYIGMSSCYAYQFHAMQNYAISNKLTPFISMQNHYSLIYREEEREMYPTLKMFGVGSIPWSPLARGLLTRPLSAQSTRGETDCVFNSSNRFIKNYQSDATTEIINRVEEIAKKRGISMAQVAVAWCLSKEGVTAPIVGTTKLENLQDIIDALEVKLTDEEIKHLEDAYKTRAVLGHA